MSTMATTAAILTAAMRTKGSAACPLAYPAGDDDDGDDQMVVEIADEDFDPRYMTRVEDEEE